MLNILLKIFNDPFCWVIMLLGLIVLILTAVNTNKISSNKTRIEELLKRRNMKYHTNKTTGELEETEDTDAAVTPDTIREAEAKFNAVCSWHTVLSQLIPIFPLMGCLGTVFGLMQQVSAEGIEEMLNSLDVALGTTLVGLFFAIILKAIDALFPSKMINDTEVMLNDFDKKLDLREDKVSVGESSK